MKLAPVDYVILAALLRLCPRHRLEAAQKDLHQRRLSYSPAARVPVWITSLAFIAANLGAQELIGMSASGAKYGIMTAHFYWIGAIPAMLFVGLFMMPFYYGSKARSVPEYLKLRFDEKTRALQRLHLRRDDHLLLGHLHVRAGPAAATGAGLELHDFGAAARRPSCWSTPSWAA